LNNGGEFPCVVANVDKSLSGTGQKQISGVVVMMRKKLSFIISAALVAGALAVALSTLEAPTRVGTLKILPATMAQWARMSAVPEMNSVAAVSGAETDRGQVEYVIGPQPSGLQEIRVWAIRGGIKYGWIQLPKGTPVHLLREEGAWLVVRYDESVMKIHRSIAEQGMVVPVLAGGRLAAI
jgi:hypothetical protein